MSLAVFIKSCQSMGGCQIMEFQIREVQPGLSW